MDSITDAMDMNLSKLLELVIDRKTWRAAVHGGLRVRPLNPRHLPSLCLWRQACVGISQLLPQPVCFGVRADVTVNPVADPDLPSFTLGFCFIFPCLWSALYMPSRKEFTFPNGNTSSLNKARVFWLLSWILKKWKVKNVQKQGNLGDLRCGRAWKQFVFCIELQQLVT